MGIHLTGPAVAFFVFLPIFIFKAYPPADSTRNTQGRKAAPPQKTPRILIILETAGSVFCFDILMLSKNRFEQAGFDLFFILWPLCLLLGLFPYALYFIKGRELSALGKPLLFFPLPAVVFPALALLFAAVWARSLPLAASAVLFAAGRGGRLHLLLKNEARF